MVLAPLRSCGGRARASPATKLRDVIKKSVGDLVDAELGKETAQLATQQIRLELSISAFNIANGNAKSVQLHLLRSAKNEFIG